jgi:hypothetical protein
MPRTFLTDEAAKISRLLLKAYRWQYVLSGTGHHRFQKVMAELLTDAQALRIQAAVATLQ